MAETTSNNHRIINLSSYEPTELKPYVSRQDNWVLNGIKNKNYKYVIDRYKFSPTNATIIDSYSNYIYGKGLTAKYTAEIADQWAKVLKLISKKELRKAVKDFAIFEEIALEIILGKGTNDIAEINHLPKQKVVPSKVDDNGEINSYWYCYDWDKQREYKPIEIPAFTLDTKEKRSVFIIKNYSVDEFYFARPSYFSALNYAELEEEISIYCINHIKNGLSAGNIINFNDGDPGNEVKDKIEQNVNNKLAGSRNAGKNILSFNSNAENKTTVEVIQVSDAHQQYQFLTEEARKQLMVGHKVTSPILFGIKDNTGFGNNADEMQVAFDELMMNVIVPKQETILDGLMYLLSKNKITIELEFEALRNSVDANSNSNSYNGAQISSAVEIVMKVKEGVLTQEQAIVFMIQFLQIPKEVATAMFSNASVSVQSLSKKKSNLDYEVADELIKLGEDIDLEKWDLVSEAVVCYDDDSKFHSFSSTGTAFPNANSENDSPEFKVRYKYNGAISSNSREFCRKMINASKIYRKEDVQRMSAMVVNEGFGIEGADTYDIWNWKGGKFCKHNFIRQIYVAKGVKVDVNSPLAEMININEARREGFNKELNDKEAFIKPNDTPSRGAYNP